jgi:hypothetical protein
MVDRTLLRLSATLLFLGLLLSIVAQFPHPGGSSTQEATFANYAAIGVEEWVAIHLAQFAGEAILLAGLLALFFALNLVEGTPRSIGFFGVVSAGLALALAGVLYAVDGVALKQSVDAWASAPVAEKAARLASAEAIRWLEWATNSYWSLARGLALILFGIVIAWTARIPRPIGYLMGLAGLAFITLSWLVGTRGFTTADGLPTNAGYACLAAVTIWLLIVASSMNSVARIEYPATRAATASEGEPDK